MFEAHPGEIALLGIDPGTHFVGMSVLYLTDQLAIREIQAGTFQVDAIMRHAGQDVSQRFLRIRCFQGILDAVLKTIQPVSVWCEGAFYHGTTPTAYGPLVETIQCFRQTVYQHRSTLPFHTPSPPQVKACLNAWTGARDKKTIREQLLRHAILMTRVHVNTRLETLDEHSLDAIAIALTGFHSLVQAET